MFVEVALFLITIVVTYNLWKRWQQMGLRDRLGIPGPPPNLLFGNLFQMMKSDYKVRQRVIIDWKRKYGSTFGYYIGPRLNIAITDVDMIKDVLVKQFNCFVDRMEFVLQEGIVNQGLVGLHGEEWKEVRNVLTPVFSSSKMRMMSNIIDERLNIFMAKMDKHASSETLFDIYNDFQALTLDVIGVTAFAMESKCQTDPNDQFLINCQKFFGSIEFDKSPLILLALLVPELDFVWSKIQKSTNMGVAEKWLVGGVEGILKGRRANYKDQKIVDILQLMLQQAEVSPTATNGHTPAEDQAPSNGTVGASGEQTWTPKKTVKLTDRAIIANSFTFLLAGYETTSTALGFTAWLLAKHPDVQKRLQEEIDQKYSAGVQLSYDLVHKMPYLDAVFRESLRLYPPVIDFVIRSCVKECTVGGYRFIPGVQVVVPVYLMHRDPELWSEPERFMPERFLGEQSHDPMTWLPFGAGPRNCIGMRFADMEYKMCLTKMLSKYSMTLSPSDLESDLEVKQNGALMRPAGGVNVKLISRA